MKDKVLKYISENSMIKEGDRVLVALSGGPDSVCLLHLLSVLRKDLGIKIFAAHVNHLIRGEEAFNDEEYARSLCESLDIKFFAKRVKVEQVAKEKGISTEMAGRDERYNFFDEIRKRENIDKIAIAHNANDQAETLIMRIMRGTGLEGLVGIKPIRGGIFIRPILSLTRDEIESYCDINNLQPKIDKTNLEDIYSRNKVRINMIPYIKEHFNPDIVTTMNRLAHNALVDSKFIDSVVDEKYDIYCNNRGNSIVISADAFSCDEAIITRVVRRALMKVSNVFNNFELKHIYDVLALQKGETGKRISLTNDIIAINQYADIVIANKFDLEEYSDDEEISFKIKDIIENSKEVKFNSYNFKFEIIENDGQINFNNAKEKYFNFDDVEVITLRTRKNGDKIMPFGSKVSKKLKDIFISSKVPKEDRDRIPVLVFDDNISWIVGLRTSELFKINQKNRKLLKISF
ncbi:MAG: tRNA lysidine(34) synthetase TilS [Sarcina sp.]